MIQPGGGSDHMTTLLRIVLWTLLIFGAGFWIGRSTVNREVTTEPEITVEAPDEPGRRELIRTTRRVIENYKDTLKLSGEQIEKLKPLFVRTGQEMAAIPKHSPLRLGALERFHREMEPVLSEEQRKLSTEILKSASASQNQTDQQTGNQ